MDIQIKISWGKCENGKRKENWFCPSGEEIQWGNHWKLQIEVLPVTKTILDLVSAGF